MGLRINKNEVDADLRRVYLQIVAIADGKTPVLDKGGEQPQVSIIGAAFVNSANKLVEIGNGRYYFILSLGEVNIKHLSVIESRFADVDTDEALGTTIQIFDSATENASIFSYIFEGTQTVKNLFRYLLAGFGGKTTGANTNTPAFRDNADGKNRIAATTDANGNRTDVTLDGTD